MEITSGRGDALGLNFSAVIPERIMRYGVLILYIYEVLRKIVKPIGWQLGG